MSRFIEGEQRSHGVLFPGQFEDRIARHNSIRAVDAFFDELDLTELGFTGAPPAATDRPGYHPATLLKISIHGHLNRVQSGRRLEGEAQRNVELVWLTGRLMPDCMTIADFRRYNGEAIRRACREFVEGSRQVELFTDGVVAIDGSKFKSANNRDKHCTQHKLQARMKRLEESIARYPNDLDRADRGPTSVPAVRVSPLKE
jgi:transposase